MQNAFRAAVLVLLTAAVVALFQMAQNGRYYILRENDARTTVLDTRLGATYTVGTACKCVIETDLKSAQMRFVPLAVNGGGLKAASADVVPK